MAAIRSLPHLVKVDAATYIAVNDWAVLPAPDLRYPKPP